MADIYCGKGTNVSYDAYMTLINEVFGFTTPEQQFEGLLPKLYKPHLAPQDSSYVVTEDGEIVAAVGAFDHAVTVCGQYIPCRGIGNVAVASKARGKGYMKDCMNAALADMVADGIALSTLGGRRQRYQYFSYEKAGTAYYFSVNADNFRHVCGSVDAPFDTLRAVTEGDTQTLADIKALCESGDFYPVRDADAFLDIARTWHAELYAAYHGGAFKGYCIIEGGSTISEVKAVSDGDFLPLLQTVFAGLGGKALTVRLPLFADNYVRTLAPIAEGGHMGYSMCYTVLNYTLVTQAFMKLKATYASLCDGELCVLIHGFAGDERLRINVSGGVPTVTTLSEDSLVDVEWSHTQAMEQMFAPISPNRADLPIAARDWFPLPLYMYHADGV